MSDLNEGRIQFISYDSEYYRQSVNVRSEILRVPLGLKFTDEQLKAEKDEIHIGYIENGEVKACLALKPATTEVIKMRQVAVKKELQKTGIGTQLILFSENYAREKGYRVMECHARKVAVEFYKRLNYTIESDEFIEVTIPHYKMAKTLILPPV